MAPGLLDELAANRGREGLASTAALIRKENHSRLVCLDQGEIDVSKKPIFDLSCGQGHPGLCRTRDALVYADALALALNLERLLTSAEEGSFIRLLKHR